MGISYLFSQHFPVSVLIALAFAYIYGSVRSKGTNDLDFTRVDNWMYLSGYFLVALLFTNGIYIVSQIVGGYLVYYALIPGVVSGYIIAEYMSAGSKYIALDRLDSMMWFATWSLLSTAVFYIVFFLLRMSLTYVKMPS